jgi:hypothetical protein
MTAEAVMRHTRHTCLALTLGLSSLALALALLPGLAAAVGLDLWNVPATFNALGQAAEFDRRLDEEVLAVQVRTALKDEVAEDVAAGRLTLVEAAARCRDLDAGASEDYRRGWLATAEGRSDEERYCRQVLAHVGPVLRGRDDAPDVLAGLNRQLEEALARGDLRLPD